MALLEINRFGFTYPGQTGPALEDLSFAAGEGEFILLCGGSGAGKSTLLRSLKPELAPQGKRAGAVFYDGRDIASLGARRSASEIGFVLQDPEAQIVCERVWQELAFGLENLGLRPPVIRRRVAEMASFFGIGSWFRRKTDALSGGQKQILNLAAVMAMQPRLLLLDEPTAQLDPIASRAFLEAVLRLNRELSLTVILSEHRLENVFPAADRVLLLEKGRLAFFGAPGEAGSFIASGNGGRAVAGALPTPLRVCGALREKACPMTVREGRAWLAARVGKPAVDTPERPESKEPEGAPAVAVKDVFFKYEKDAADVLRGFSFEARPGRVVCLLGGNGEGKSTALSCMAGVRKPYRGAVSLFGKPLAGFRARELYTGAVALLPQSPRALFSGDTVREDLEAAAGRDGGALAEIVSLLGVASHLDRNPGDLSGGELQKAALAKLLLRRPKLLLLDEPTKGLDARWKEKLGEILRGLCSRGVCVVAATHDLEFAVETADRCVLLFDGAVVSEDGTARFFAGNSFYTTAANRMSRGVFRGAVTCGDVVELCRRNARA